MTFINPAKNELTEHFKSKYPRFRSSIINEQNRDKPFGRDERYTINVGKFEKVINGFDYDAHGIYDRIQVASQYDFAGVSKKVNFTWLE